MKPANKEEYIQQLQEFKEKYPVGTKVKVKEKAESYSHGCGTCWTPTMNKAIGQEFSIIAYTTNGVKLEKSPDNYTYPFFVLEPVDILPEKWCIKLTEENISEVGGYYNKKARATVYTGGDKIDFYLSSHNLGNGNPITGPDPKANFLMSTPYAGYTEISFEQFKKHILKTPTTNMSTQTISRKGMKEIHDIACSSWKDKIKQWAVAGSSPFSDEITLSNEQVKQMFNAADGGQRAVLLRYFKENNIVKAVDLKKGQAIRHTDGWVLGTDNGPIYLAGADYQRINTGSREILAASGEPLPSGTQITFYIK